MLPFRTYLNNFIRNIYARLRCFSSLFRLSNRFKLFIYFYTSFTESFAIIYKTDSHLNSSFDYELFLLVLRGLMLFVL
jgi:hypothetical protein